MIIICPFGRPKELERVLAMWCAQTVPAQLLLVSDKSGQWAPDAIAAGALVLSGLETIGAAKNAGVEFARGIGEEWATVWDDDDYYGPRYIEQATASISEHVDALTQGIGFVRFDDGLYFFEKPIHFCPGHCSTFRVSTAPKFPEASLGEDVAWSRKLDWSRVAPLPPWHSVYHREGSDHAFDATQDEFMKQFEPCRRIGSVSDSFVDAPSDLSPYPYVSISDEMVFASLERRLRLMRAAC